MTPIIIQAYCRIESNRIEKSIRQRESNRIESNFFSTNRNALVVSSLPGLYGMYAPPTAAKISVDAVKKII